MPIGKLEADADKFTRALPAVRALTPGGLWFPSVADAPWVQDWIDEHAAFPNAAHDDTVDVTAYAARVAAAHWLPMETAAQEAAREARPDPDFIDFETANW
jgi:predicted phage terminase large subunit-like protein